MLYLDESRKDSSDCASETTGMQADSRNTHRHRLMLWFRRQGSGHHLTGIRGVGAPALVGENIVALDNTSSHWIKLHLKSMLGNETMRSLL